MRGRVHPGQAHPSKNKHQQGQFRVANSLICQIHLFGLWMEAEEPSQTQEEMHTQKNGQRLNNR